MGRSRFFATVSSLSSKAESTNVRSEKSTFWDFHQIPTSEYELCDGICLFPLKFRDQEEEQAYFKHCAVTYKFRSHVSSVFTIILFSGIWLLCGITKSVFWYGEPSTIGFHSLFILLIGAALLLSFTSTYLAKHRELWIYVLSAVVRSRLVLFTHIRMAFVYRYFLYHAIFLNRGSHYLYAQMMDFPQVWLLIFLIQVPTERLNVAAQSQNWYELGILVVNAIPLWVIVLVTLFLQTR